MAAILVLVSALISIASLANSFTIIDNVLVDYSNYTFNESLPKAVLPWIEDTGKSGKKSWLVLHWDDIYYYLIGCQVKGNTDNTSYNIDREHYSNGQCSNYFLRGRADEHCSSVWSWDNIPLIDRYNPFTLLDNYSLILDQPIPAIYCMVYGGRPLNHTFLNACYNVVYFSKLNSAYTLSNKNCNYYVDMFIHGQIIFVNHIQTTININGKIINRNNYTSDINVYQFDVPSLYFLYCSHWGNNCCYNTRIRLHNIPPNSIVDVVTSISESRIPFRNTLQLECNYNCRFR